LKKTQKKWENERKRGDIFAKQTTNGCNNKVMCSCVFLTKIRIGWDEKPPERHSSSSFDNWKAVPVHFQAVMQPPVLFQL